jgi:hypothetical protein
VTPFDRAPVYRSLAGEFFETAADDWREFMAVHAGHRLEPLMATGNRYFPTGASVDPSATVYIEVTDGNEKILLQRMRPDIAQSARYVVVDGELVEQAQHLEVQEKEIRKEMKLHFSCVSAEPLEDAKVELFIDIFRKVVRTLDPQSVPTSGYSCDDDNITYGRLDNQTIDSLLSKCREHFSPPELQSLCKFIDRQNTADGVMALIKRRSIEVESRAEASRTK